MDIWDPFADPADLAQHELSAQTLDGSSQKNPGSSFQSKSSSLDGGCSPVKFYAISDVYADDEQGMAWIKALPRFPQSVLLIAGNVGMNLGTIEEALRLFALKFDRVFHCFGDREAWCQEHVGNLCERMKYINSLDKLNQVRKLCNDIGISTGPELVAGVWVVPILGWYHHSWDHELPLQAPEGQSLTRTPKDPGHIALDVSLCRWGDNLPHGSLQLAQHLDNLNELWGLHPLPEGLRASTQIPIGSRENPIVTFSHFLPRLELLPEKRFLVEPNLAKVSGSNFIQSHVDELQPDLHIFGHSQFPWDMICDDGVRYRSWPLGNFQDRARRVAMFPTKHTEEWHPLPVFDSDGMHGSTDEACWMSDMYEHLKRNPRSSRMAPYVAQLFCPGAPLVDVGEISRAWVMPPQDLESAQRRIKYMLHHGLQNVNDWFISKDLVLLQSAFDCRPPVILFREADTKCTYPVMSERAIPAVSLGPRLYYSHTELVTEYDIVVNVIQKAGLSRVSAQCGRWCLLWSSHPSPEILQSMTPSQVVNHFPGSFHLGRKDLLWRSIYYMARQFGPIYRITPQGYVLPRQFDAWATARYKFPEALWIYKPCNGSCGRGIRLFSNNISDEDIEQLEWNRGIVQRYISNPFLFDGYKFDLRIYVVVLSYDPLKIYINSEGLVRLATQKYSMDADSLDARMMHLTNYSINKFSPDFVENMDGKDATTKLEEKDSTGEDALPSKLTLQDLREYFEDLNLDYDELSSRINELVIKTLIAVEPQLRAEWCTILGDETRGWNATGENGARATSCFELYGFDVLVDSNLKPWLIEVNIKPSLASSSPLDVRIKSKLVADLLTLVGLQPPQPLWNWWYADVHRQHHSTIELSDEDLKDRAEGLAHCSDPRTAIASFDRLAWDICVQVLEEDMRSGGLQRIFPCADAAKYAHFFEQISYANLVLWKWEESGGKQLFANPSSLPSHVPRLISPMRG